MKYQRNPDLKQILWARCLVEGTSAMHLGKWLAHLFQTSLELVI